MFDHVCSSVGLEIAKVNITSLQSQLLPTWPLRPADGGANPGDDDGAKPSVPEDVEYLGSTFESWRPLWESIGFLGLVRFEGSH